MTNSENATTTALTDADFVPGTVFVFTKDLSFMEGAWATRVPGTHFVVTSGPDHNGIIVATNTRTNRAHYIMLENWIMLGYVQIIGSTVCAAHSWVAGMMYVSPEDLNTVAARREVTCEYCDAVYGE